VQGREAAQQLDPRPCHAGPLPSRLSDVPEPPLGAPVLVASVGRTRAHNRQYRGLFLRPTEGVLISGWTKASVPGAVLTQARYTSQRPDTGGADEGGMSATLFCMRNHQLLTGTGPAGCGANGAVR
jgi:hypothetical protein